MKITVETRVNADLATVWSAWTTPEDIMQWNNASPDWHTPAARLDLRAGGRFCSRMEARDGSMGFDFEGTFTAVVPQQRIAYCMDDDREVTVLFAEEDGGVRVTETFDAESEHPADMQRTGWQAILDNFARHAEARHAEAGARG